MALTVIRTKSADMIFLISLLFIVFTNQSCHQTHPNIKQSTELDLHTDSTTATNLDMPSDQESDVDKRDDPSGSDKPKTNHIESNGEDVASNLSESDRGAAIIEDAGIGEDLEDNGNMPHSANDQSEGNQKDTVSDESTAFDEVETEPIMVEENTTDNLVDSDEEKEGLSHEKIVVGLHDPWNKLLQAHVSPKGAVNYNGFKADKSALNAYLDQLSKSMPASSDRSPAAMAYWINAYNAFTIKLIVDNYPLSSIRDLSGGDPWKEKWVEIGGKMLSLNNIEHDILRPTWKDARIHFAVNCAAKSCPPIANVAFTAENLESLLEDLTGSFINNSSYNKISSSSLSLSRIFDWYKDDFGNVQEFVDRYTSVKVKKDAIISYLEYNWKLNSK